MGAGSRTDSRTRVPAGGPAEQGGDSPGGRGAGGDERGGAEERPPVHGDARALVRRSGPVVGHVRCQRIAVTE